MGLQQCENQRRRRMESGIQNQQRIIRTNGYVLWTMQFPCDVSKHDGPHILRHDCTRISDHLYGRPSYSCQKQRRSETIHQTSSPMTMGKQHVLQTTEMWIWKGTNQISRNGYKPQFSINGPNEAHRNQKLANSDNNKTSLVVPWIWKLLPKIYQEICTFGKTIEQPVKERRRLRLDKRMSSLIQPTEEMI